MNFDFTLKRQHATIKALIKAVMQQNIELAAEVAKLKSEMRQFVEQEVRKSLGDKIAMIEGSLRESILHKEILIDKGFFTREEVNAKYKELREAN